MQNKSNIYCLKKVINGLHEWMNGNEKQQELTAAFIPKYSVADGFCRCTFERFKNIYIYNMSFFILNHFSYTQTFNLN